MATKTIATILTLKDKMSEPLGKTTKEMKKLRQQAQLSVNQINKFGTDANSAFLKATRATAKFGAVSASIIAGMAGRMGFSEAVNLEGYRMQLETATKDSKKAADIMRYSVNMANKTPYEAGPLVEAASKFEALGLSAKKYLMPIGDMAAATNKSLDQAVEARIDAQNGELERLKEFGITKRIIADQADKMFGKQVAINNKGQIVDQKKFNEALDAVISERFKGGMDKQATTLKGTWSTVTGITKSALAEMFGMTADGTIRTGSMFENMKKKISEVAKQFEKWQSDGTFTRMGEMITQTVDKSLNILSTSVKFVKDNFNWLAPVLAGTVAGFTALNVISKVVAMYKILKTALFITTAAQAGLNATMALSPMGIAVLAIAGLVTAGTALYMNFDKVTAALKRTGSWIKNLISGVPDFALVLAGPLAPILLLIKHFEKVKEVIGGAFDALKKFFGASSAGNSGGTGEPKVSTRMDKFAKGGYATKPSICGEGNDNEWVIPDNKNPRSKQLLAKANASLGGRSSGASSITVAKLADQIIVREEADIDKITNQLVTKLKRHAVNL